MKKFKPLFFTIPCQASELNLHISLQNGQSFRWREVSPGIWRGMIKQTVWSFSQDDTNLHCVLHNFPNDDKFFSETTPRNEDVSIKIQNPERKHTLVDTSLCLSDKSNTNINKKRRRKLEPRAIGETKEGPAIDAVKSEPHECPPQHAEPRLDSVLKASVSMSNKKQKITKSVNCVKHINNCHTDDLENHSSKWIPSSLNLFLAKYRNVDTPSNISSTVVSHYMDVVRQYFRLDVNLVTAYKDWCARDPNFQAAAEKCPGVRLLDQPPVENVFSFICSSNNNISRISGLVEKLCVEFGSEECEVDGHRWFSFPTVDALAAHGVDLKLRTLGFGYRAAYIHKSAQALVAMGGEAWLLALRKSSFEECRQQLRTLPGIGPKVADCISLMSLDKLESIPVDTHVFQIAARDYLPHLRQVKSVTQRVYAAVALHFQQLYGRRAGWAHSVLFSADLKKFTAS